MIPLRTTGTAVSDESRRRAARRLWLGAGVLLLVALAAAVWLVASPKPDVVKTTTVAYGDLESSVSSSGRVVPEHEFVARASFPGLIDSMDVHLGQVVSPGQVLLRMKDPFAATRVASATAVLQGVEVGNENAHKGGSQEDRIVLGTELERAQADMAAADASLETLKHLQESGAASEAEVRAATQRVEAADAALRNIQDRVSHRFSPRDIASWSAKVSEARSGLAAAKVSFANTNITSPLAGTVYLIPITGNDFVGTGQELLRVADLGKLEVHANFEEAEMGKLHEGAAVQIRWDGRPDRLWHGVIKHAPFAAVISGVRSVGECIITITDARADLPPNTTVNVTVTMDSRQHVPILPREALQTEGGANFVYLVKRDALVRTPVQVGLMNLDHFQVLGGIGPDDHVALHALDNRELFNGMPVRERP